MLKKKRDSNVTEVFVFLRVESRMFLSMVLKIWSKWNPQTNSGTVLQTIVGLAS